MTSLCMMSFYIFLTEQFSSFFHHKMLLNATFCETSTLQYSYSKSIFAEKCPNTQTKPDIANIQNSISNPCMWVFRMMSTLCVVISGSD